MIAEGAVPLDMQQSRRMFGTVRVPGRECDALKHYGAHPDACRHIAVFCKGCFYKLPVYRRDGSLRGPDELEDALAAIKRDAASATAGSEAEACLSALTSEGRTRWAEVREAHFSEGVNRRSLHAIESAILYLVLAEDEYDVLDWGGRGKRLLAGARNAPDVWYDKSICLVVQANGQAGLNAEHSWADAPAIGHMWEVRRHSRSAVIVVWIDAFGWLASISLCHHYPSTLQTSLLLFEHKMQPYSSDGHVRRLKGGPYAWDERAEQLIADERGCRRRHGSQPGTKAEGAISAAANALATATVAATGVNPSTTVASTGTGLGVMSSPTSSSLSGGGSSNNGTASEALGSPLGPSAAAGDARPRTASGGSTSSTTSSSGGGTRSSSSAAASGTANSPPWVRLCWSLNREAEAAITSAVTSHQRAWDDLDLRVGAFREYGKDFVKRCRWVDNDRMHVEKRLE